MALDPRISLGVQPMQLADPLAQYGKIAAIQQAQNQNALAQYQLSAAQRADEQVANRLRVFQEAGGDPSRVGNALLLTGDVKGYTEFTKGQADVGKTRAETIAQHMKLSEERLKTVRTPEDYLAWHQSNHADPVLAEYFKPLGITAEGQTQKIMRQLQQPGGFEALFAQSALGLKDSMKRVLTSQTLGGTTRIVSTPEHAMAGTTPQATVVPGSVGQVTMTPGEQANVGLRGQELALARQKERRIAEQGESVEISPKEVQKREAAYPKATSAVKNFEANSDSFIKDLQTLRDHPGLSNITGVIAGRTPSFTRDGRAAQALYDKIVAKGGFQALQALREASTTGGALGSVSNQEGKQLVQSFAAIDQRQDAPDVQAAIDQVIQEVEGTKARVREAYDMTYDYKARRGGGKAAPAQPGAPMSPATPGVIDFGSLR